MSKTNAPSAAVRSAHAGFSTTSIVMPIIIKQTPRYVQLPPLPVVRTRNAHWHVRRSIEGSALAGDAQQPDGQRYACREEEYEHDQTLSETSPVVQGSVVGDHQHAHQREQHRNQHSS